jgi:hypothetical protein
LFERGFGKINWIVDSNPNNPVQTMAIFTQSRKDEKTLSFLRLCSLASLRETLWFKFFNFKIKTNMQLIECVPNFSEGNDLNIIKQITNEIESVEGVRLLNVDPGKATNRTVVTMVGQPANVIEAAYKAIKKAGELIDMSKHKGEHPRMGATDVCPLIPIANISMEETAQYAQQLAKKSRRRTQHPCLFIRSRTARYFKK